MSNRHDSRTRRCRTATRCTIEQLERRDLKAGNVSVWVDSAGTLNVRGDGASNGVAIAQVSPTSYMVTGLNVAGATRINGGSRVVVNNVWDDVNVDLGNGDDYLGIGGTTTGAQATLLDDLFIAMGAGNDRVDIRGLSNRDFNDRMFVDTGSGSDAVSVSQVSCRDLMDVRLGSDNDRLTMSSSSVGRMFADLGAGDDVADIRSMWFGAQPTVDGGTGFDSGTFRSNSRGVLIRNFESWS